MLELLILSVSPSDQPRIDFVPLILRKIVTFTPLSICILLTLKIGILRLLPIAQKPIEQAALHIAGTAAILLLEIVS